MLALSGGVDSSVAAIILSKAIGKGLTCVFVDHGLLRKNEGDEVEAVFSDKGNLDLNFIRVDASERFYNKLKNITDPEQKRKIIGEEFIRVFEEEAKKIQEIRYGDKVSVIFQVDKELNTFYIPKLLIQPIVENAIVHGIEGKVDESTIFVKVEKSAQDINIIIEDNGIGISPETLDKILSKEDTKTSGHTSIGISNVNKRIQMVYGKEYGMYIDSIQGQGTKITLHIKKVYDPLSI
ncbi:hypothetical protein AN642_00750 [Epulopiscium sp. SCG-B10WGA-EpuloA2]|nr:hypothetical protein AN642_00750 [Epulopiscium sp. SCG-B10WGA-EpuloA2]